MLRTQLCWTELYQAGSSSVPEFLLGHVWPFGDFDFTQEFYRGIPHEFVMNLDSSPSMPPLLPPSSRSWLGSIRYGRHSAGREHKQTVEEEPRPQIFFNYPIFVFVALESFTCGVFHRKRGSAGSRFGGVAKAPLQSFTPELQQNLNNPLIRTPTT